MRSQRPCLAGATVVSRPRYRAGTLILFLALSGPVTPADGTVLPEPPAEVSVAIPPGGVREAHLTVATSEGVDVTAGPAVMRDGALVVPVRIAGRGSFLVAFHLVLPDGRVDSGVIRFGVGVGVEPVGHSTAHAHPEDPLNLVLTAIAALLVSASLYILLSPSPRRKPGTPRRC